MDEVNFLLRNKRRAFIIHGWGGSPHGNDWLPWAKNKLENKGYEVILPLMPDPIYPKIEIWIPFLSQVVGEVREDDIFIGHSIGCQTILRFLETLPDNKKVNKVILVAPWGVALSEKAYEDEEDKETAKPWLETPINWDKIRSKASEFVAIFSDNDPVVPLDENRKMVEDNLGAKIIVEQNKGHFSESDGVIKLPIMLEYI